MRSMLLAMTLIATQGFSAVNIAGVNVWGKVEVAPAYLHLDIIEGNHTRSQLDMAAIRSDAVVIIGEGWNVRPNIMWGKNGGEFFTTGIGFGRCIPFREKFIFTPLVGVTYSQLLTSLRLTFPDIGTLTWNERFEATAPWVGLEACYIITPCWRLTGQAQYAWSRSHTVIKHNGTEIVNAHDDSQGPNFGLLLEHDLNKNWSVNVGMGWNLSLSRDKNGIRGRGTKVGLVRWF